MRRFIAFAFLLLFRGSHPLAQGCSNFDIHLVGEVASTCAKPTMTMIEDVRGLPYLYIAQKEGGLKVVGISDPGQPEVVATLPIEVFANLDVMSLTQREDMLYLAVGNSFGTTDAQYPGLMVVDVSQPRAPRVRGWMVYANGNKSGAGIVAVQGSYAYLGAMGNGVIVLDVSNPDSVKYVSSFLPDRNFPIAGQDTLKVNARGMTIQDHYLYLAYDAGGFRVIDIQDPTRLSEVGRYANRQLDHLPRAYNNVVIVDTVAFVTTDYCGIEALSVSDPANPRQLCWWNPWNCTSNPLNWFSSPGHTNEVVYDASLKKLFVSTGKSDLYVVNAEDPRNLDSCAAFGGVDNGIGTWGISAGASNRIYLSYICTAGIPFASNWSGVKILSYSDAGSTVRAKASIENPGCSWIATRERSIIVPCDDVRHVAVYDAAGGIVNCPWSYTGGVLSVILPKPPGLYSIIRTGNHSATMHCLRLPR